VIPSKKAWALVLSPVKIEGGVLSRFPPSPFFVGMTGARIVTFVCSSVSCLWAITRGTSVEMFYPELAILIISGRITGGCSRVSSCVLWVVTM
jgi:hypothetical protein